MSQQLRVTRKVDFTGATQIGVGGMQMFGAGNIFYVNGESDYGPNASDGNDGKNPNYPLATIAQALSLCEDGHNDYIFVIGSYQTDTFPLNPAKQNIHIVGIGGGGYFRSRAILDGQSESVFKIDTAGNGLELAGLRMGCSGGTDPAILINTDSTGCYIHDCSLGLWIPATSGIYGTGVTSHMMQWTVEDCYFGNLLSQYGIFIQNINKIHFVNNVFAECVSGGIIISSGWGCRISGNEFSNTDGFAVGGAILLGSTEDIIVNKNYAMEDGDEPGNNPYKDTSASGVGNLKNPWGINYKGISALEPATA